MRVYVYTVPCLHALSTVYTVPGTMYLAPCKHLAPCARLGYQT